MGKSQKDIFLLNWSTTSRGLTRMLIRPDDYEISISLEKKFLLFAEIQHFHRCHSHCALIKSLTRNSRWKHYAMTITAVQQPTQDCFNFCKVLWFLYLGNTTSAMWTFMVWKCRCYPLKAFLNELQIAFSAFELLCRALSFLQSGSWSDNGVLMITSPCNCCQQFSGLWMRLLMETHGVHKGSPLICSFPWNGKTSPGSALIVSFYFPIMW